MKPTLLILLAVSACWGQTPVIVKDEPKVKFEGNTFQNDPSQNAPPASWNQRPDGPIYRSICDHLVVDTPLVKEWECVGEGQPSWTKGAASGIYLDSDRLMCVFDGETAPCKVITVKNGFFIPNPHKAKKKPVHAPVSSDKR